MRHVAWLAAAVLVPASGLRADDDWREVRSPHFRIISNASEERAREVARRFEHVRSLYERALPDARVDGAEPLTVFAVRNEKSLRELAPVAALEEGRIRPAGLFIGGVDRQYAIVRTDTDRPFSTVDHELFHQVTRLNLRRVTPWLDEGLAEFWSGNELRQDEATIGIPDSNQLRLLRDRAPVPLSELLDVDRGRELLYREKTGNVAYAQAWALTHYLYTTEREGRAGALGRYIDLLQEDLEHDEILRRVFGDLAALEMELRAYVAQSSYQGFRLGLPWRMDPSTFEHRELSQVASAIPRADLLGRGGRYQEARALLEGAVAREPDLPEGHEALGMLLFREGDVEGAAGSLRASVELGSTSHLAHYQLASLEAPHAEPDEVPTVAALLRRAIALSPAFAPAHAELALFLARRTGETDEAVELARRAVALEPGTGWYHRTLGYVLLGTGRAAEAVEVARRAVRSATTLSDLAAAQTLSADASSQVERQRERALFEGRIDPSGEPTTEVEGRLVAVGCPGGDSLLFSIRAGDAVVDLVADAGSPFTVIEEGASVSRSFDCGATDVAVLARYSAATAAGGRLRYLELLEALPDPAAGSTEVRGRLQSIGCPRRGVLDFVVAAEGRTLVLRAETSRPVALLEKGAPVRRRFECGPQDGAVRVRYSPPEPGDAGIAGRLLELELLQ